MPSSKAMTGAERQKKFRDSQKAKGLVELRNVWVHASRKNDAERAVKRFEKPIRNPSRR